MTQIERRKTARQRVGVSKTHFDINFVYRDPANVNIPGTDIPRLKQIPLGEKAVGFLSTDVDKLIDALSKLRGTKIVVPAKPIVTSGKKKKAAPRRAAA